MKLPILDVSKGSLRRINESLTQLQPKRGTCSLDSGGVNTTTTVTDPRVGQDSVILLSPTSSAASSENWYISAVNDGSFVVTHSAAGTSRTFGYAII